MPYRRNVFIVGAGFSADAGAPVIKNFFERAMDLYKDPDSALSQDERAIFRQVFGYRASLQEAEFRVRVDPDNIEELFGLVEMATQLEKPNASNTRKNLIYVILRTLELTTTNSLQPGVDFLYKQGPNRQSRTFLGNIYDFFVNAVARRWSPKPENGIAQDAIISLNYDLLLEEAMEKNPALSSLNTQHGLAPLAPLYGLPHDLFDENSDVQGESACRIRLFKLHGSANWAICRACKETRIRVLSPENASVTKTPPKCSRCGEAMGARLIVPPAWNKEEYMPLLRPVWSGAADALSTAQRIWILGYSMPETDKFFRYLLAVALQKNAELDEVIVVNSDQECAEKIASLFRSLHERGKVQIQGSQLYFYIGHQGQVGPFQYNLKQVYPATNFAW